MKLQFQTGNRAFSLVEALCAVLILGIALVSLTQGMTAALTSTKQSEIQSTAVMLAAGRMETLRAEGYATDGSDEGEFDDEAFSRYRWRQTITSSDIEGLHEVEVVIENSDSGEPIYELKTMLFDPPLSSSSLGGTEGKAGGKDNKKNQRRGPPL